MFAVSQTIYLLIAILQWHVYCFTRHPSLLVVAYLERAKSAPNQFLTLKSNSLEAYLCWGRTMILCEEQFDTSLQFLGRCAATVNRWWFPPLWPRELKQDHCSTLSSLLELPRSLSNLWVKPGMCFQPTVFSSALGDNTCDPRGKMVR